MPSFKIAHLKQNGVDLIIVPLDSSFGDKPTEDQNAIQVELQVRAARAELAGTVVPVWERFNRFYFIAPAPWRAFFKSITMAFVVKNLNRTLTW
jgi:hypothetical protein